MKAVTNAMIALFLAFASTSALAQVEIGLSEAQMREMSPRVLEFQKILTDSSGKEYSLYCAGRTEDVAHLTMFTYEGADRPDGVWAIGTDTGAVYTLKSITMGDVIRIEFVAEGNIVNYYLPRAGLESAKRFRATLIEDAYYQGSGRTRKRIPRTKYAIHCSWASD